MKKIPLFFSFILSFLFTQAQHAKYDTLAILIVDRMSDVIGDLNACSYTLHTSTDKTDEERGVMTYDATHVVYMVGPDKMLVNSQSEKGHREFWYNGSSVSYYSFDENNYAVVDAPDNIVETMDTLHKAYGLDFPAADFFYPTFTDDLIDFCDNIYFLGLDYANAKECFHVLAVNKDMNIQIWIANDATTLPEKFVINYSNKKRETRYEANFSDWQLNPDLPMSMFEFLPPPQAHQVYLLPQRSN